MVQDIADSGSLIHASFSKSGTIILKIIFYDSFDHKSMTGRWFDKEISFGPSIVDWNDIHFKSLHPLDIMD